MHAAEIVVHEIKGNGGDMVFDFLGKRVGQACGSSHAHSHSEVLPFNETCRDVLWIRPTRNRRGLRSNAFRGAVACFFFVIFAVNFIQHCVVDVSAERVFNGGQIGAVSISCELNTIRESRTKIVNELMGASGASISNEPRHGQLGIRVNRNPGPNIAESEFSLLGFWNVCGLGINERPNLVALNPARFHVADMLVMIHGTGSPNRNEQARDRVSSNASQPARGADRVSFNEATDNFDLRVSV